MTKRSFKNNSRYKMYKSIMSQQESNCNCAIAGKFVLLLSTIKYELSTSKKTLQETVLYVTLKTCF